MDAGRVFFSPQGKRETGFTAEVTEVRGGLGCGRLARLWNFFAISEPPREILNHAGA
jgi:hypothetical protein